MEEIGFHSATGCSAPGRFGVGTKALDRNVNGNSQISPADDATSGPPTERPMSAPTHSIANANSSRIANAASAWPSPLCHRQPTMNPQITMTSITNALNTRSPITRPAITPDRAIGNDRNRSISPFDMSSASPTLADATANAIVWAKIPDIRNSRYARAPGKPGIGIAFPNTYANSSTNMIG